MIDQKIIHIPYPTGELNISNVINITDDFESYGYAIETKPLAGEYSMLYIHIPNRSPVKLGKKILLRVTLTYFEDSKPHLVDVMLPPDGDYHSSIIVDDNGVYYTNGQYYQVAQYVDVDGLMALAEPRFKSGLNRYDEYIPIIVKNLPVGCPVMVRLMPVTPNNQQDMDFTPAHGTISQNFNLRAITEYGGTQNFDFYLTYKDDEGTHKVNSNPELRNLISQWFGKPGENNAYMYRVRAFVTDAENIYCAVETELSNQLNSISVADLMEPFNNDNDNYIDGLQFVAMVTVYKHLQPEDLENVDDDVLEGGWVRFLGIRTDTLPITPEIYSEWIAPVPYRKLNLDELDMVIYQPRIVNTETVSQNITVQPVNPRQYISHPIFIETQKLTDTLILHPRLNENKCINLHSLPSLPDSIHLMIGNYVVHESARTAQGSIFKIIGSELPDTQGGKYYIIDNDTTLIYSGKYQIEE